MVKYKLERIIIAAISKNGIIGSNNKIPWKSKEELKHFKKTTINHPIIMGRKTFDSLLKPLPDRLNIVISSSYNKNSNKSNLIFFKSLFAAYNFLRLKNYEKVFICGGEKIYRNCIKHAEKMILSHMDFEAKGDVKFPKINTKKWEVVNQQNHKDFTVKYYERQKSS